MSGNKECGAVKVVNTQQEADNGENGQTGASGACPGFLSRHETRNT
jgi:hypothetical protein